MYIGIDLGTSSVKTILIDHKQNVLSSHTQNIKLLNPKIGHYEQDPETWFLATLKCFKKIKQNKPKQFASVISIAISGQMHGATLIDKNHKILRNCILWNDTRSKNECKYLEENYPNLRKESGNIAMPGFTAPKLLWIKKNETKIFKKIYKVLLPKDYLRYKLTGEFFTDMSDASGTLWLDVKNRSWSEGLLGATDLSVDNMPNLLEGNEVSGTIDKKLANQIGFKNSVTVAAGAGDQAAGAAGVGVFKSNQSVISLGTSGVYFSPIEKFHSNTKQAIHTFCHCLPNMWHQMSVMLSATNCLDWICKITNININDALKLIDIYITEKLNINSSPYFLPYLSGERTPYNNPDLRGAFHMINTSTEKDAMLYSVIEGISFGIKDGFDAIEGKNSNTNEIYIVGGGSKSIFWSQLISSTLNKKLILGQDSNLGPSLGAARLAMLSNKNMPISDVFYKMKFKKVIQINKQLSDILDKRYKVWKDIVLTNEKIAKRTIVTTN